MASSLVGQSIIDWILFVLISILSSIGNQKAAVFQEPV